MLSTIAILCVLSAPIPVPRPPRPEPPPFTVGAILDATWQFGGEQSPPTKWVARFNKDGTYEGYIGRSVYCGHWTWDGKKRVMRIYESLVRENPMARVSEPALYILHLDSGGSGYTESGARVRFLPPIVIDLKK